MRDMRAGWERGEKKEREMQEERGCERKYSQWRTGGQTDRKKRGRGI